MTRLYDREIALTVAKPVKGEFFRTQPNATVVTDLRLSFTVERSLGSDPNTCSITITNLAETTRAAFQTKPLHIRLDVGFDGNTERLFTGDLRWAHSKRTRTGWDTIMQIADGDRAYRFARVNRSFKSGVTTKTALEETAKSMGLKFPTTLEDAKELFTKFQSGLTLSGPSSREMTRLLKPHGMNWSIQNGQLQILRNRDARQEQAILVNQDTGMIGSPEFGSPPQPGKPPVLSVRMLIYPSVVPGSKIRVESDEIKGLFRVDRVTHTGDTHGSEWYTTMEAKSL
jgi:hypothetical protein